jgi:glycine/D-amino acid oxidase-like deaminating enzyme
MELPAARHTRHGWWLEEAGPVVAQASLEGDTSADVLVVGGGYLGLWTAWQVKQLEPGADVVLLDSEVCGHGPSGRNGGFVSTLWDDLPILRDRVGDASAVAVCRASERAVRGIDAWCAAQQVDAWFRLAGTMQVSTAASQDGDWDELIAAADAVGVAGVVKPLDVAAVNARCAASIFRGGAFLPLAATVQPARLALGLRRRAIELGVRVFEHTAVDGIGTDGARVGAHRVKAGATVLAVGGATAGFSGLRRAVAVASSHIVLTEPVPDVIEELGWTGGEAIHDCRTLLHYLRTTRDGRIAFGWGGGRMGVGGRLPHARELDRAVVERASRALVAFFPALRGREITHAWGGPIDVSPTHLPIFGSRARVHHGFGFTGNGVGPSYLGGEILARLALDRRDELTRLAIVDPAPKRFPPEPFRVVGGSLIRAALVRRDAAESAGRRADPLTRAVAGLPRRLGLRLPR